MRIKSLIVGMAALMLASCGSKPVIKGNVLDNFGKPITDARVAIKNSAFATSTDSDGAYEVDFVPGSFTLTIQKPGYTSVETPLNIAAASAYPMGDVRLYKIPPTGGFYLQGADSWIPLGSKMVNVASRSIGFMSNSAQYFLSHGENGDFPVAKSNHITVADTTTQKYGLVHVHSEDTIGAVKNSGPLNATNDIRGVKEEHQSFENFTIRTATLPTDPDNLYCYIRGDLSMGFIGVTPVPSSWAYCFSEWTSEASATSWFAEHRKALQLRQTYTFDFDSGTTPSDRQSADVWLESEDGSRQRTLLAPQNGAQLSSPFKERRTCMGTEPTDRPVALSEISPGSYFCLKTRSSHYGVIRVSNIEGGAVGAPFVLGLEYALSN